MSEFKLNGLDGGNPLAFLAALGTLRMTTLAYPEKLVRMRWQKNDGGWRPYLVVEGVLELAEWIATLNTALRSPNGQPAFGISRDLNLPCEDFRSIAVDAKNHATKGDRCFLDFLAAFGSEIVEAQANGKKTGLIADTAFRTMSGAGHQHFLRFMSELEKLTEADHLRSALFESWKYEDPGPSMRWDPADDRRYAQRWKEPSGDPLKTVRGANRLAIEALPLFPTAAIGNRLETTGFSQRRRSGAVWTWAIWSTELSLYVVRSLLSLSELQRIVPNRKILRSIGIEEVYRCQRITQGKYRNFSQAIPT
ncbi:type I-G CRISPR-associated protein, Cas3-extension family [Geoalkalibacter halelectricus]|uniref:Uncharacterized protein n=1 Tax=Geoalkalibacter halelectricus TaxID=2847045 RepID=A0ABY5ZS50_9BACT|nr:hypothetical protein [Geoalkalibacter halelectricus]MDO3377552.1 hypothetical protein [Geoalkalibacter halelectricus]UWZ80690.1 hypothetical protein L9S41_04635 [Geoalkalibacter halelectricus]